MIVTLDVSKVVAVPVVSLHACSVTESENNRDLLTCLNGFLSAQDNEQVTDCGYKFLINSDPSNLSL